MRNIRNNYPQKTFLALSISKECLGMLQSIHKRDDRGIFQIRNIFLQRLEKKRLVPHPPVFGLWLDRILSFDASGFFRISVKKGNHYFGISILILLGLDDKYLGFFHLPVQKMYDIFQLKRGFFKEKNDPDNSFFQIVNCIFKNALQSEASSCKKFTDSLFYRFPLSARRY